MQWKAYLNDYKSKVGYKAGAASKSHYHDLLKAASSEYKFKKKSLREPIGGTCQTTHNATFALQQPQQPQPATTAAENLAQTSVVSHGENQIRLLQAHLSRAEESIKNAITAVTTLTGQLEVTQQGTAGLPQEAGCDEESTGEYDSSTDEGGDTETEDSSKPHYRTGAEEETTTSSDEDPSKPHYRTGAEEEEAATSSDEDSSFGAGW